MVHSPIFIKSLHKYLPNDLDPSVQSLALDIAVYGRLFFTAFDGSTGSPWTGSDTDFRSERELVGAESVDYLFGAEDEDAVVHVHADQKLASKMITV